MNQNFEFKDNEGVTLGGIKWLLDGDVKPKAIIQISHGMVETIDRYAYFAEKLNEQGYAVYGHEHRGHGKYAFDIGEQGYMGGNGFNGLVENVKRVTDIIKEENPGVPVILFGHSMGSFVSQRYAQVYGDEISGLILSGSNGQAPPLSSLGILISKMSMMINGKMHQSKFIDYLSFATYSKTIKKPRTKFDWLSRCEESVDKYLENKYCGFACTNSFYNELIKAIKFNIKKENVDKVPKELPIYILSGDDDPVGLYGKGVKKLYNLYKEAEVKNVKCKLYEGGRHEMLNEINKDEVINDILDHLPNLIR